MPRRSELIAEAHAVLAAVRAAADPRRATQAALGSYLAGLEPSAHLHLFAIGKASLEMSLAAIASLGDRIDSGLIAAVPERVEAMSPADRAALLDRRVTAMPCDHPSATARNVEFAAAARAFVSTVPTRDRLLALISGGGSAHLASPPPDVSLDDLQLVTSTMLRAGATIGELNAVRKHVETLKGGRLAEICPARVDAFVVSDVIGDRLDVIASGPFAPDPSTYADALDALRRRGADASSPAVTAHLIRGTLGALPETPKPGAGAFDRVRQTIIAGNRAVVRAAAETLSHARRGTFREEHQIEGTVEAVAERLVQGVAPGAAVILGGEWAVDVRGSRGVGGPSQELALRASVLLEQRRFTEPFACLCYSTDGVDGPTDAAGVIVTDDTLRTARARGLDPIRSLGEHDSFGFFAALGAGAGSSCEHLRPGPTGTNVNHVAVLLT